MQVGGAGWGDCVTAVELGRDEATRAPKKIVLRPYPFSRAPASARRTEGWSTGGQVFAAPSWRTGSLTGPQTILVTPFIRIKTRCPRSNCSTAPESRRAPGSYEAALRKMITWAFAAVPSVMLAQPSRKKAARCAALPIVTSPSHNFALESRRVSHAGGRGSSRASRQRIFWRSDSSSGTMIDLGPYSSSPHCRATVHGASSPTLTAARLRSIRRSAFPAHPAAPGRSSAPRRGSGERRSGRPAPARRGGAAPGFSAGRSCSRAPGRAS
jgi:hypothetical protein